VIQLGLRSLGNEIRKLVAHNDSLVLPFAFKSDFVLYKSERGSDFTLSFGKDRNYLLQTGKTEPCDYCDYNSFELQNRSNVYFNYGASLDFTIVRETAQQQRHPKRWLLLTKW
jgi:hypothetical protein